MLSVKDILRPKIININGRRYRQLPIKTTEQETNSYADLDTYIEEDIYFDEPNTCVNQPEWNVVQTSRGYEITIEDLPMFYYGFMIGPKGTKKKKIEQSCDVSVAFPTKGEQGNVRINGKQKCNVTKARNQLQTIIELHRAEQPATHFLCIPLDAEHITSKFSDFKQNVLALQARGVDGSIFQEPKRLHLTLCLTSFLNDAEVKDVLPNITDIIKRLKRQYFDENVVRINLQGIEYMNDDPSEVDVLYAKVQLPDHSQRLQKFVDELLDALSSAGHVHKQFDHVKLHATIMNTLFRENKRPKEERVPGQRSRDRITFDATQILELYRDYEFGGVNFKQLDISLKGSYDKDGRYKTVVAVPFET